MSLRYLWRWLRRGPAYPLETTTCAHCGHLVDPRVFERFVQTAGEHDVLLCAHCGQPVAGRRG